MRRVAEEAGRAGPLRVAVLASGSGSNFEALVRRFEPPTRSSARGGSGEGPEARIVLLVASRDGIGALDRAAAAGVRAAVLPMAARGAAEAESEWLLDRLGEAGAELVVLAGWLRLVPAPVVAAYRGRMLNIHPALLPAFGGKGMYGRRVHETVLASGARVSGATVHLVDEAYDRGPILAQWPVPVRPEDDAAALASRVLDVEHRLLPAVVAAFARRRPPPADGRPASETAPAGRGERGESRAGAARLPALPWSEGERFVLVGSDGAMVEPPPVPSSR